MAAHNQLELQFQEIWCSLWPLQALHTHDAHTYIQAKHPFTQNKGKYLSFLKIQINKLNVKSSSSVYWPYFQGWVATCGQWPQCRTVQMKDTIIVQEVTLVLLSHSTGMVQKAVWASHPPSAKLTVDPLTFQQPAGLHPRPGGGGNQNQTQWFTEGLLNPETLGRISNKMTSTPPPPKKWNRVRAPSKKQAGHYVSWP